MVLLSSLFSQLGGKKYVSQQVGILLNAGNGEFKGSFFASAV